MTIDLNNANDFMIANGRKSFLLRTSLVRERMVKLRDKKKQK